MDFKSSSLILPFKILITSPKLTIDKTGIWYLSETACVADLVGSVAVVSCLSKAMIQPTT